MDESDRARERRPGAEGTRAALLEAARELFTARGFDRTTVRAIAERAEVNQALLFRYFGSKDALFAAALSEQARALAAEAAPEELLATTLRRIVGPSPAEVGDTDALLALLRSPGNSPAMAALRDELAAPYHRAFSTLAGDGSDAELRADLLLAWLLGIAFARSVVETPSLVAADPEAVITHVERAASALLVDPTAPGTSSGPV